MPKFPGVLLNNNPNAPSLDLNDLQVKGVGIFADVAERDALDVNIQTEGYLSVMKNDDNVYIYKGGGWTTPANWEKISGTIGFTDSDGNPLGEVSTLVFPEGSISIVGSSGVVAFTAGGTSTDTTNFNGVLSSADTTVQAALDTLDGLSLTLEGLGDTPSGYGTAGQVLITNGVDGFTFGSGSPWDENASGITYDNGGSVAIISSTDTYQGSIITGLFGSSQSAPGGSRASRKLLHLHEGQLIFSTETNTPVSHIEMSNQQHSGAVGGAIGTSTYNMRIHGYHALEFTHGSTFSGASSMVSMDMPTQSAQTGVINIGAIDAPLGGISLPSFGPGTVNTTNYSISMGGRIIFKNHSNIVWDAITQGPGGYQAAGVSLSSPSSANILTAVSSDSNTQGSYGYVGINSYNPTPTGPAFEVSSSYAKFNNGLHIGDITATGYAFPTATGTTGQVLKVDANGDLVFGDDEAGLWTEDTNGITYTAGNVGIGTASSSTRKLVVTGGVKLETFMEMDAGNDGNNNIVIGSANNYAALTSNNCIVIGNNNTIGASNPTQTVVIGRNKDVSSRGYRCTDIGFSNGSTYIDGSGTNSGQVAINGAAGSHANAIVVGSGSGVGGNYSIAIGGKAGTESVTVGNSSYYSYYPNYSAVLGRQIARFHTGGDNNVIAGYRAAYGSSSSSVSNSVLIGQQVANNSATNTNNVMVGYKAGYSTTTGSSNVFLGYSAGYSETGSNKLYIANSNTTTPLIYGDFSDPIALINGDLRVTGAGSNSYALRVQGDAEILTGNSVRIGSGFGSSNNNYSVYIGKNVGSGTGRADQNVVIGRNAAGGTGAYFESVIIGSGALTANTAGTSMSVLIGYAAGSNGGNGTQAVGVGFRALMSAVGAQNTGIGPSAGRMAGGNSTFVGSAAGGGSAAATGVNNVGVGSSALQYVEGNNNTAVGTSSAGNLTTGSGNIAIGRTAGSAITTESYNTFIGYEAGRLTTSSYNTFIGNEAGESVTTALNVTAVGSFARGSSSTGSNSVMLGASSSATGSDAIALGRATANGNEAISIGGASRANAAQSIAVGYETQAGSTSIVIGNRANRYTGTSFNNVILGFGDRATFGNDNVSVGNSFIQNRDDSATLRPRSNVSLGHANFSFSPLNSYSNLVVGGSNFSNSGASAEIAYNAVMSSGLVGTGSPMRNTVIGQRNGAGQAVLGDDNVFLGYNAGFNETGSNKLYIANSNTTTPLIYGEFDNSILNVNGHLGVNIASDVSYPLTVGGGAKLGGKLAMYSDAAQTAGNVLISYGNFNVVASVGTSSVLIGGIINSTSSNSILIGYNITGSGQDFVISSSTYHSRCVIASSPSNVSNSSVAIYKASAVGAYSVAIGQSSRTDGNGGIAIGLQAKDGNGGVGIGNRAGTGNTNTDTGNVNIGTNAGHRYYNPGGQSFNNTVNVGHEAGRSMAYTTTITGNSVNVGYQAGYFAEGGNNVMVGYRAGYGVDATSLGSGNVFLGYQAGYNETGSNKLYIANSNTTTPLIYGEFDNYHVKINGTYAGSAIGFWPGNNNTNNHISIGDQDYMGIGAGTSVAGFQMLFDSTITNVDYASGLWIGKKWNVGILKNDVLIIGNRITGTATSGNTNPKIVIGNGVSWGATTNNANGILIGASITGNIGGGVVIGGTGNNFNGVSILSQGNEGSQGGTAILGECRGYSVTIGAAAGRAGVGSSGAGQKVYVGINAGKNSSATTAIGASAGQSVNGSYVTAIGSYAFGDAVATASANTAVGDSAGRATTGGSNTFIGARAAISNTTGNSNTAIGGGLGAGSSPALAANITGSRNISIGVNSLETATAASDNIALGHDSGKRAGGSKNIFLGYRTAYLGTNNDTNIANNVVIGHQAGYNTAGSNNVFVGEGAGFNAAGTGNVMLGTRAGYSETGSNRLYISSGQGTDLVYGEFDNDFLKVNGDLEVTGSDGLILNSPNGTRYKVTVSDAGVLSTSLA